MSSVFTTDLVSFDDGGRSILAQGNLVRTQQPDALAALFGPRGYGHVAM